MHQRSIVIAAISIVVAAGCRVERKTDSADTATNVPTAKAADTSASPSMPAPSGQLPSSSWTVTPAGIGAIRVGMHAEDLRRVAGNVDVPNAAAECSYVRPGAVPPGVSVMLARGEVARVDVDSAGVRSDAGVAIGDGSARVTAAYAGRVTATPHKYIPGGQYLTVRPTSPEDSTLRIVFETDSGRVTRIRSGRIPEVEWVERCG